MGAKKAVGEKGRHFPGWNMLKEIDDHPAAEPILSQATNDVEQLPVVTDKDIRGMGAGIRITSTPKEDKIMNRPEPDKNVPLSLKRKLSHGDTIYEGTNSGIHQDFSDAQVPENPPSFNESMKSVDKAMVNLDSTKYADLPNQTNKKNTPTFKVDGKVTEKLNSNQSATVAKKRTRNPLSWDIEEFEAQGQAGLQILVWEKRHESDTSNSNGGSNLAESSRSATKERILSQNKDIQNSEDVRSQPVVNLTRLEFPRTNGTQQQIVQEDRDLQTEDGKTNYQPDLNRTGAQPLNDDIEMRNEQPHRHQ
ncbi:hypothetical protein QAD02_007994 [Eretmocerus hayati]|uniref:Uncharacterized protein n=1 Tax=Eretmocerus hayati TaxID=131215 RepID=A0ACC2N588_9HYME|nr:hypothetical protein QAD02_007994 [Eretmocerus hayati]